MPRCRCEESRAGDASPIGSRSGRCGSLDAPLDGRTRRSASRRFRPVVEPEAAFELIDCDYIFLAADGHLARMVVNAVAHQFLIPAVQLGTRIDVDEQTGAAGDIRTNVRPILPGSGCLRCNGLISPAKLQEEATDPRERERNRYVDEIPAPSVITFNTWAASQAATDFLLSLGEFLEPTAPINYLRARPRLRKAEPVRPVVNKPSCRDCGTRTSSRRARGQGVELPLPERRRVRGAG